MQEHVVKRGSSLVLSDQQSSTNESGLSHKVDKLKKRADKAFNNANFEKAHRLYKEALDYKQNDYDLNACYIGTCINLGLIQHACEKCDFLISIDAEKAQGYYLQGVLFDLTSRWEEAINSFLKALEYETENSTIIIKNLIKVILDYLNLTESVLFHDTSEDEATYLLKLIEATDLLISKNKIDLAFKVMNYIDSIQQENYKIKAQLLMVTGKLYKIQGNLDKALIAFEETHYLANLKDDYSLKLKSIVSISACYLEKADLQKAIYYYHKLIDLEKSSSTVFLSNLKESSEFSAHEIKNLELKIAIRQNLFNAHNRLGKLRLCSFYLNEIIEIIDDRLGLNDPNVDIDFVLSEWFDFVQIKIDATIELVKLYLVLKEYMSTRSLLDKMLQFVEKLMHENQSNQKQLTSIIRYKIKCYSFMGICLAATRDYRLSKLSTRKCLCLIDHELQKHDKNNCKDEKNESSVSSESTHNLIDSSKVLVQLKVECLLDASNACGQMVKTFKEMVKFNACLIEKNKHDKFDMDELSSLKEADEQRINFAKHAFLLSKTLIDPNIRVHALFTLAMSLYENEFYQSAAYYFNELLSISTVLLEPSDVTFYSDASIDYHLEANIYMCKCQLIIDYFQADSIIKLNSENEKFDLEFEKEQAKTESSSANKENTINFDALYKKLLKHNETLLNRILKWKLNETVRASFQFSCSKIDKLKQDRESERLNRLYNLCNECLMYIAYKVQKYDDCLIHIERASYLLSVDLQALHESGMSKSLDYLNHENLLEIIRLVQGPVLRYKFLFDSKLLIVFLIEPEKGITFYKQIKTSQIFIELEMKKTHSKGSNSELEFWLYKFEIIKNHWFKEHLDEIECRHVPSDDNELKILRETNRAKEKSFFTYLHANLKSEAQFKLEYHFETIDLSSLKLSEKLKIDATHNEVANYASIHQTAHKKDSNMQSIQALTKLFSSFILSPIETIFDKLIGSQGEHAIKFVIDSKYLQLFSYALTSLNQSNETNKRLSYLFVLDSYFHFGYKYLTCIEQQIKDEWKLEEKRQEILASPRRPATAKNTEIKIPKKSIIPKYTSNPRLAINLLNENPSLDHVLVRNDHVNRLKARLDSSISVLISQTITGTDAKRSKLEIINYEQVHNNEKCCVMGCPDLGQKFLKNGFDQLKQVASLLYTEPIFSNKMTKQEVLSQLSTSTLIFISTFSTNDSNSTLICSPSHEYPSSSIEIDKYCKLDANDLNSIDMHRCNLLILNCYSFVFNKPKIDLAKKLLSRGCQCVLLVLTPLADTLMNMFYVNLINNLKQNQMVIEAYLSAVESLLTPNTSSIAHLIRSAFCLIGCKSLKVNINDIAKTMVQKRVDQSLEHLSQENKKNYLNRDKKPLVFSENYTSSLEVTLNQLQILIKLLLNQTIEDCGNEPFKNNKKLGLVYSLTNELIEKALFYMKTNEIVPELVHDLIYDNQNILNLLECLGFCVQYSSSSYVRDHKQKKMICFPERRFLDLNLRATHILECLMQLCFEENTNVTQDRIKSIIFNLQALLPIDNRHLLACLIDIISLTKFSPEIMLSTSDSSVMYVLNYFQIESRELANRTFEQFSSQELNKWSYENLQPEHVRKSMEELLKTSPNYISTQICNNPNNKIANFLFSIGFEFIGQWLRFNESEFNQLLLDLMLKFFTSFTLDRDMSLYTELNINVMGLRSARRTPLQNQLREAHDINKYDFCARNPWGSSVETLDEMNKKRKFIEKYELLSNKMSQQRNDLLKHHLNYVMKQHAINIITESREELLRASHNQNEKTSIISMNSINNEQNGDLNKRKLFQRIKYKPGGGPSRDRIVVDEKLHLSMKEVDEIRNYSDRYCQKHINIMKVEQHEKSQNLLLPLIKK